MASPICSAPVTRGPLKGLMEATGTTTGVSRHRTHGETPCPPCAAAASASSSRYYWNLSDNERERIKAKARDRANAFRAAQPERYKLQRQTWRVSNPGPQSDSNYRNRLRYKYQMSLAEFDGLMALQGGGCAICGSSEFVGNQTRLDVDHDHSCCPGQYACGECIRGLLCRRCNMGLGYFGDNLDRLIAAAAYVMGSKD